MTAIVMAFLIGAVGGYFVSEVIYTIFEEEEYDEFHEEVDW